MDPHPRDEAQEAVLGEIIAHGSDAVLPLLNDTDGLEGQGEEAGYGDRTMEEEGHDYDGSGDRMSVQEGDRDTTRENLIHRILAAAWFKNRRYY